MRHVEGAAEQLAALPEAVSEPLYEQLSAFRDRVLAPGEHVELLLVEGRAVRLNLFVDTDGTLWVERLGL
ncbi:MAG: hypothetical protein D6731_22500 [Planctomycetota bacterium]|nr:MAG: hypothetical protein D6731_22500 [Planctomycetota bacterium]